MYNQTTGYKIVYIKSTQRSSIKKYLFRSDWSNWIVYIAKYTFSDAVIDDTIPRLSIIIIKINWGIRIVIGLNNSNSVKGLLIKRRILTIVIAISKNIVANIVFFLLYLLLEVSNRIEILNIEINETQNTTSILSNILITN